MRFYNEKKIDMTNLELNEIYEHVIMPFFILL